MLDDGLPFSSLGNLVDDSFDARFLVALHDNLAREPNLLHERQNPADDMLVCRALVLGQEAVLLLCTSDI